MIFIMFHTIKNNNAVFYTRRVCSSAPKFIHDVATFSFQEKKELFRMINVITRG